MPPDHHDELRELRELRERAYGLGGDIHSDPAAMQRLHELEHRSDLAGHTLLIASRVEPDALLVDPPDPPDADVPTPHRETPRSRLSRSTIWIAILVALIATGLGLAFTLVQRVQTDPLQAGATQVARLAPDTEYEVPQALNGGQITAYADFYGLRTLIRPDLRNDTESDCMTVLDPTRLTSYGSDGYSYEGPYIPHACAAGKFPAIATFTVTGESPTALRDAFPIDTALQFVFDSTTNEIVVFKG